MNTMPIFLPVKHPFRLSLTTLAVLGLTCLAATPAAAQGEPYYYGGVGFGQSRANVDGDSIASSLLPPGITATSVSKDQSDMSYKVFGGYQMNRNLAIEAGYFKLGTIGFNALTTPPGTLNGQMRTEGLNLDLVGSIPLTEKLSALARVGMQYAQAKDSFNGTGAASSLSANAVKKDTNFKMGLGVQYAFNPSLLIRGEVERYRINGAIGGHSNADVYSISLVIPFGRTTSPKQLAVATPTYVAPAATSAPMAIAPAPVATAAPMPMPTVSVARPARQRVNFSADSLFRFDHSDLQTDGKQVLDKFVLDLRGVEYDSITVEGHTDRLGSPAYNQTLSLKRASSVKTYLVATGGVSELKITAIGKGETSPTTKEGDCPGVRQTSELVRCLQPDRRVDVEVQGTRTTP
jgi:OOP family OmpA-OmpF porin